nr:MAG TPA: hypothetical protein [Caudoviricetes sp.]
MRYHLQVCSIIGVNYNSGGYLTFCIQIFPYKS